MKAKLKIHVKMSHVTDHQKTINM